MITQEFITYALGIVALLNVGVAIWTSIKKPQEKSEVNDAVFDVKFDALDKVVTNLRDNHIHTLQEGLNKHIQENQMFAMETTKSLSKIETLVEQLIKK